MKAKNVIINFLLCYIVALFATALINKYLTKTYTDSVSLFFYLLIIGFPTIVKLVFIYFFFLFTSYSLLRRISGRMGKTIFLLSFSVLFFFVVLGVDWSLSANRYHNFYEYAMQPNVYTIFSIISIVQCNIFLIILSRKQIVSI